MPNQRERIESGQSHEIEVFLQEQVDKLCRPYRRQGARYRIYFAAKLRDAAEAVLQGEIAMATESAGMTWREVGELLGVSAQAAHRRYH
ncbi:hypothetical protein AB0K43_06815 [Kitasatospora sp. NPDC049258]|uniref:hypothetical protein n=1 Tax=Kitasatospora sp. NPDC049258 TaxID=3155394 RepID=UPI00342D8DE7